MNADAVLAAESIDLSGGWDKLWSSMSTVLGTRMTAILTAVGVALIAWAFLRYVWFRRKGDRGQHGSEFAITLVLGCILAAPALLLPLAFNAFDIVANTAANIFQA